MTEWQSIETAPEDGTIVIIYEEGKAVSAFYDSSTKQWVETMDYYEVPDPTHWMPLPKPPEPNKEEAAMQRTLQHLS